MEGGTQNEIKRSVAETFSEGRISIGTPWKLFVFSLLLFAFSLLVYFGLSIGYKSYLTNVSKSYDEKMIALSNSISEEDQQRFINIFSQIINLKDVLDEHLFVFNVFPFLEENTLDKVFYRQAQFNAQTRTLTLEGEAENLQVLAAQLVQFDKAKEVESSNLTNMRFNPKGNTSFGISITFKKDYLSKPK
jgi:hypothetical protein